VVHERTGFLNEFTHIKPHYAKSKMDEMAISAALVANGTNLGIDKMYLLCDIAQSDLNNADKNYIRLSTLKAANDVISNAISKLAIFKFWNLLMVKKCVLSVKPCWLGLRLNTLDLKRV
jgi:hypothetical protein